MKCSNIIIASVLMLFTASSFAINTVQLTEKNGIDFSDGKPKFKKGVIIKNGKAVQYDKCQYRNPNDPNKQPESGMQYCNDNVPSTNNDNDE